MTVLCVCGKPNYGRGLHHPCCKYWVIELDQSLCLACSEAKALANEEARRFLGFSETAIVEGLKEVSEVVSEIEKILQEDETAGYRLAPTFVKRLKRLLVKLKKTESP